MLSTMLTMLVLPVIVVGPAGCEGTVPAADFREVQRQLQSAREEAEACSQQLLAAQQANATLRAQVARQAGLTRAELIDELVVPVSLDFASMSGGYDQDGRPGDDGLVLFIQPLDREGHVIKAAGSLKVTILDPQAPPESTVVYEKTYDVPATRALWHGRLLTNHFTVRCPWPEGRPPAHSELTAFVVFTDLLTGRAVTAQRAFKVRLPVAETQSTP